MALLIAHWAGREEGWEDRCQRIAVYSVGADPIREKLNPA